MTAIRAATTAVLLAVAACGGAVQTVETMATVAAPTTTGASSTTTVTTEPVVAVAPEPSSVVDIPDAVALSVAADPSGGGLVAWTVGTEVRLAPLDAAGLGDGIVVSGDAEPFVHPIERPAVVVAADGTATVAFTSLAGAGASVQLVSVDEGAPGPPETISGEPRPETVLVHLTLDASDQPVAAWLEDSTLSVARSVDGSMVESEAVDDLTCDCCHPSPVVVDGSVVVAYRDLERSDAGVRRDLTVVVDAGDGFGEPTLVADDPWFLDACPLAGASVVAHEGRVVVAWMDARQALHPDQRTSTVWVDSAEVGGPFGADVAVTGDGVHGVPSLTVDGNGVLHLVWETRGPEAGLSYASSADGGGSFTDPVLLVPGADGVPQSPTAVVDGRDLVVSWADRSGGHVGRWSIEELTSSRG